MSDYATSSAAMQREGNRAAISVGPSFRGSEAGKDAKYNAMEEAGWEQEYAAQQGAAGIAGASKRAKPEYKAGLETFKAARRRARAPKSATKPFTERLATEVMGAERP